jgi:hypothetical protein
MDMEAFKQLPAAQQEALAMKQMASEVEQQQLQGIIAVTSDICLKKCLGTSGNQLDRKEQNCMANCMDRYIDTMKVVGGALSHAQS